MLNARIATAVQRHRGWDDCVVTSANGLCDSCVQQKLVPNTRGSVFSLCLRSREDPAYPRYPRMPVTACPGYEPETTSRAARSSRS